MYQMHSLLKWVLINCSRGCPLGSHTNAQQDTSLLLQRDFATKAEEYDLITGDDQLARIDG